MCGVTGFWTPQPLRDEEYAPLLSAMGRCLAHRGPDSRGAWHDAAAGIGLAHTRLAIVDLSPAGHQPMASHDGRLVASYNGEVYNAAALRKELEAAGAAPAWRGHSDTEVLLEAVRHWGLEAALARMVGMFALALWDREERSLTLVRDRLGVKPLFYGYAGPSLLFGSELAPLRAHPHWQGGVDRRSLALYLRHSYVPSPHTIHPGIHKLEPGTLLTVTAEDLRARRLPAPVTYWSVAEAVARGLAEPLDLSPAEAAQTAEELLGNAVEQRMVADVPLGALLSGGIDSSLVTALMQARSSRPIQTFSIGARDPEFDEAPHAAAVARRLGTSHTELYVEPQQALDVVPLLPRMYDEPFADASQIPTHLVSRLARERVTVALTGDGGDEGFGGYNRHLVGPGLWRKVRRLPRGLRRSLAAGLDAGGARLLSRAYSLAAPLLPASRRQVTVLDKVQKVAQALAAPDRAAFHRALASYWNAPELVALRPDPPAGEPGHLARTRFARPWPELEGLDFASWMMAMDQLTYLPDDGLTKVDRASMAVALEARVPLLDHRVVEFAWRLPLEHKIRGGTGKQVLRRVLANHLPPEMMERPKRGFSVPLGAWLRGPLREWADELLAPETLRDQDFLAPLPVRQAWDEHQAGAANRQYHLWSVLMFQAWLASGQAGGAA